MSMASQNSLSVRLLLALWHTLTGWLSDSGTARLYYKIEGTIIRWLKGSALCSFLARQSQVTAAWEESLTARLLDRTANGIPALLHKLYRKLQPMWDGSLAFRLAAGAGENVPAILSWLFLAMMLIEHGNWNNMYSLLVAVLCLCLVFAAAMRRPGLRLDVTAFHPYLWAFFFLLCVGVVHAVSRSVSLRYLIYFVSAILLALLVMSTVDSLKQLKRLAAFGCAGIPVAALYGVYQLVVLGFENSSSTVDMELNANMPGRVISFFDNANTFAQVLVMMLALNLGLIFASKTFWGKLASAATFCFGLVGIAMTYSRASWIGLVAAVFLFVLIAERRLIPVLIVGAVAMLPFLPASIYNRILTIFDPSDSSTSSRFPIFSVGLKVWNTSPVIGIGLGSELSAKLAHNSGWYHQRFKFPHYHNIYLQLAVELGILGAGSYVAGFVAACKETLRAVTAPDTDRGLLYMIAGCFSGLAGIMVCGLADYFWHYPRVMAIFWLIFGMMLCGIRLAKKSAPNS